ncbi:MAG TPA: hypothetical protein EYP64_06800, partial [Desulfarculaceae bacterium]|nr:hypothetical protein [Desulfarculaceae bacterium]
MKTTLNLLFGGIILLPMLKQSIFFSLVWTLMLVPICFGGELPVASIVKDLSAIEAAVIVRPNGQLLLNKGSNDLVRKGDLWSLYSKGEVVLDPVSGEELGSLDEIIGSAMITRTDKRFSEIELTDPAKSGEVKTGQQALRYDGVKAIFQDGTGANYPLYEKLRAGLPSLNWEYKVTEVGATLTPPRDALLLAAAKDRLTVWGGGEIVKVYEMMRRPLRAVSQPVAPGAVFSTRGATSVQPQQQPVFRQEAFIQSPQQQVFRQEPFTQTVPGLMTPGMSARLGGQNFRSVGSINSIAYNLDLLNFDGQEQPWFVYLTNEALYCQPSLGGSERYAYRYEGFGAVANVSTGPGGMIALNVFNQSDWQMQSYLLRFTTAGFQVVDKDIPYILAYIDIDNDGVKDLVGQNFDEENFFGTGVYRLAVKGASVKRAGKVKIPAGYRIYGSFMTDMDNDNIMETGFYNVGKHLLLYEQGREIWQSSDDFGGSIQVVMIDNIESEGATARNEIVWCPPAVISHDQGKLVALVHNDPSLLSIVGVGPSKGSVSILYKANGQYFLRTLDANSDGPVQSV